MARFISITKSKATVFLWWGVNRDGSEDSRFWGMCDTATLSALRGLYILV